MTHVCHHRPEHVRASSESFSGHFSRLFLCVLCCFFFVLCKSDFFLWARSRSNKILGLCIQVCVTFIGQRVACFFFYFIYGPVFVGTEFFVVF